MNRDWASDTEVSQPVGIDPLHPPLIETGAGWAFTDAGLVHLITPEEREEIFRPQFLPKGVNTFDG